MQELMSEERVEERDSVVLVNGGKKLFGILHIPTKARGKAPVVLMCHGLAGHKSGEGRVYVAVAESLSERGIATLRIDFRGCGDSEGSFSEVTLESQISDALLALNYLDTLETIDSARIALLGKSFGGAVAIKAAVRYDNVKSIALWAPLYDGEQWQHYWDRMHKGSLTPTEKVAVMTIGGQVAGPKLFAELFNSHLDNDLALLGNVPLLHIHGEKDTRIDLSHADKYRQQRQGAAAMSSFVRLSNSDHHFAFVPERQQAIEATVDWFGRTL